MPIESQAQRGLMYATEAGAHTGVPLSVAKEFVASDHPGKLPEHVRSKRADGGANDNDDAVTRALAVLKQLPTTSTGDLGQQTGSGRQQEQAPQLDPNDPVSSALLIARQHLAYGGMGATPEVPFFERAEARNLSDRPYGFSVGTGGGRTDKNPIDVGAGSYVLPADVVAGLGESNSLAGAKVWDSILHSSGPFGIAAPQAHPRSGERMPRLPSDPELAKGLFEGTEGAPISPTMADGGKSDKSGGDGEVVPIMAADGEIIVSPDDVARIGEHYFPPHKNPTRRALIKHGHDVLDEMVKEVRGRTIAKLESLPGPAGSANPKQGHNPDARSDKHVA